MFFERIKTPGIAHIAYLIAEQGVAAIVDPCRDVQRYLEPIEEHGLTLRFVLETHRQEDFVMGGAMLQRLTGAEIVAAEHEIMRHADRQLADGEELKLSEGLTIRALATPGHTPESLCYAVTSSDAPDRAWGVFSGDALFIGDTGRTDLTDPEQTGENAGRLYDAVHEKILPLGDQALVLPAHGSGSACGGSVADRDHSTIGLERVSNAVATKSREEFIRHKCAEQLARPPYFRLMEEVNLEAGRPWHSPHVPWLGVDEFARQCSGGILIDTREPEAFAGGHIAGAYSIWLDGLARYGGWITDEATPIYLLVDDAAALRAAQLSLARIGRDNVAGALRGGFAAWRNAGLPIAMTGSVSAQQLAHRAADYRVLDVREIGEFEAGHIADAVRIHVGELEEKITQLDVGKDQRIAVTCSVGHRGSLGASILARQRYREVYNLLGGMTAWKALDLPLA